MEFDSDNLTGMNAVEAKNYIFGFVTTLKLTEKDIDSLEHEAAKWKARVDLARSRGTPDLLIEAEREVQRIQGKLNGLRDEERVLKTQIDFMRKQFPGLAARERTIDPDLLEQELLMALGQTEEEAMTERAFGKLEKEAAADVALDALKDRMKG